MSESEGSWGGWIGFAAVMMIMVGVLNVIDGLVAIIRSGYMEQSALPIYAHLKTWGWVWLILGVVVVISAFGVMSGNVLARGVGVLLAALNAMGQMLFLPAYPIWSVLIIVVDILVIWALIVHGGDMRRAR